MATTSITPATVNFIVRRGADGAIKVKPKNNDGTAFDHTGSTWRLTAYTRGRALLFALDGVLGGDGFLTFTIPNRGRDVPLGKEVSYEIERRIGGTQEIWMDGVLEGAGGLNED